ncbi:MAG: hypothetical protein H0V81_11605 [Solirubrobacterales bacterium]|nr:hypothetical protein [Solirubrobacterales bacterium]
MRKTHLALAAATVASAVAVPTLAGAAISEIGPLQGETAMPDPSCPNKPCLAISRTTGYQVKVGDTRETHTVKEDGRLVAWTIKLSKPDKEQVAFFDKNLGGEASAQITVFRPGNKLYARILAQGDAQKLEPYFGQTVQFALEKSIPVKKGNVIGLSVPTWAPALAINQPGTVSWRATRNKGGCNDFATQTAQSTKVNNITRFFCLYRTARITYTATIVSDPKKNSSSRQRKSGTR